MPYFPEDIEKHYFNHMAPNSQRQLPVFSHFGKGIPGNSAKLYIDIGETLDIVSESSNEYTGEQEIPFRIPLDTMIPRIHYELWNGVQEVNGFYMEGWWIRFFADIDIRVSLDNNTHEIVEHYDLWSMNTPFVPTEVFHGSVIPEPTIIDTDVD